MEKILESPWSGKGSSESSLKQITGSTDAEVETPILWPPNVKN